MKKRLFLYTTIILLAGLASFFIASVYITHRNNLNIAKSTVMEITSICAGLFNENIDLQTFVSVGENTRITIISVSGEVLADSNPPDTPTVENHLNRPEVIAAARNMPSVYLRHSNTHGADFIYYALQVSSGDSHVFIRASIPVAQIDAYLFQSLPLLIFLLFTLTFAAFLLVSSMANRILQPFTAVQEKLRMLSGGKHIQTPIVGSYAEIDKITKEIDDVALVLQNSIDALSDEKTKLIYILNSISDGLFVVDENENIVNVNTAACNIFNTSQDILRKKLNYLIADKTLINAIKDCTNHSQNALFELTLNGKIYLTTIKRLPDTTLTMTALADITESRENAKRREVFFTNASHELKTPLTAISGFNELATLHNKDENISRYIDGIARETNRMTTLISSMLNLSELENATAPNLIPISLSQTISEVKSAVSTIIEEKNIKLETKGDAIVLSQPEHLYEIIKNLIENAIRYNNKGGKVIVKVESTKKLSRLTIHDTGIGISAVEQTKIFERFYRVEKSRSAKSGGTGLGLAIVKHTCALYGWKLSLKSKLGVGTEVVVEFSAATEGHMG